MLGSKLKVSKLIKTPCYNLELPASKKWQATQLILYLLCLTLLLDQPRFLAI
jgi:hypothetical protein